MRSRGYALGVKMELRRNKPIDAWIFLQPELSSRINFYLYENEWQVLSQRYYFVCNWTIDEDCCAAAGNKILSEEVDYPWDRWTKANGKEMS